jgi:hypothetical protein
MQEPPSPKLDDEKASHTDRGVGEVEGLNVLGYTPELRRNRSLFTLLFQSLAIAAIPYGKRGFR